MLIAGYEIEDIGLGTAQFAFRDRTATASGHNSHSGSDLAFLVGGAEGIRTLTPSCHGALYGRSACLTVAGYEVIGNYRTLSEARHGLMSAEDGSPLGSPNTR